MTIQASSRLQAPRRASAAAPTQRRDFFAYAINFFNLGAGQAQNGAIQIQADSDFELQKMAFFADIAGGPETADGRVLPLVALQITDTGTGRQIFNTDVPVPATMGDGQIPFILPTTKIFSANASVAFQVTNYSAATTYNLRLVCFGAKLFQYG